MKTKAIGILDSGLGGYTFYRQLTKAFEGVSFVLIADQKNAPFGDKSVDELLIIGTNIINQFIKMEITTILFACNTLSSTVFKQLQEKYPQCTLISIIDLTIHQVSKKSKSVLVFATTATIGQKAYSKALSKSHKNAWILEVATPKLVPLIEGLADDVDIDEALQEYFEKRSRVDTLVLGCTHYPLIKKNLEKFTQAEIVDALEGSVQYFNQLSNLPPGESQIYTTLNAVRLAHQIKTLFKEEVVVQEIVL